MLAGSEVKIQAKDGQFGGTVMSVNRQQRTLALSNGKRRCSCIDVHRYMNIKCRVCFVSFIVDCYAPAPNRRGHYLGLISDCVMNRSLKITSHLKCVTTLPRKTSVFKKIDLIKMLISTSCCLPFKTRLFYVNFLTL